MVCSLVLVSVQLLTGSFSLIICYKEINPYVDKRRLQTQSSVVSILLYGCTTWTLTKRLEKKLDGNYTRMLRAIFNKSWRQHLTRHQQHGHLLPITKTIQVRRTRHVLLWTPTYGRAKRGRPARTYIQQLCEDTSCSPEDLPEAMNDREKWRERVRDIRASGTIWWWWWWLSRRLSRLIYLENSFCVSTGKLRLRSNLTILFLLI